MALRPVFVPSLTSARLVDERAVEFTWVPGMAPSQKKKNVLALHAAAAAVGLSALLEISSKSTVELGVRLSAFSLKIHLPDGRSVPLESAFQGSKVFEYGGPYADLYLASPREAKRDPRLQNSGRVIGFRLLDFEAPSEPRTLFYDWLYVRCLAPHTTFLERLDAYDGFTDIEFNPKKSLNCQARSCALFVSLSRLDEVENAARGPLDLLDVLRTRGGSSEGQATFL
jgi:hypothetical protein